MANKEKVRMVLAVLKGENIGPDKCPLYEFKDGKFEIVDGELIGDMEQIGYIDFPKGFDVVQLPLSEKDKQEIEMIERGESPYHN